jgi:hypothetical protein
VAGVLTVFIIPIADYFCTFLAFFHVYLLLIIVNLFLTIPHPPEEPGNILTGLVNNWF